MLYFENQEKAEAFASKKDQWVAEEVETERGLRWAVNVLPDEIAFLVKEAYGLA